MSAPSEFAAAVAAMCDHRLANGHKPEQVVEDLLIVMARVIALDPHGECRRKFLEQIADRLPFVVDAVAEAFGDMDEDYAAAARRARARH